MYLISVSCWVHHDKSLLPTKQTVDVVKGVSVNDRLGAATAEPHKLEHFQKAVHPISS